MIIPDKKKAVSVILAQHDPKGESPEQPEVDENMEAKKAMAEEMLAAMHSKSPEALMSAMDAYLEQHDSEEESETPEEETAEHMPGGSEE